MAEQTNTKGLKGETMPGLLQKKLNPLRAVRPKSLRLTLPSKSARSRSEAFYIYVGSRVLRSLLGSGYRGKSRSGNK